MGVTMGVIDGNYTKQKKIDIKKKFRISKVLPRNTELFGPSVEIRTRGLLNPIQ